MTLEDISVVFGDPVELSFEQALSKEGVMGIIGRTDHTEEKGDAERVREVP